MRRSTLSLLLVFFIIGVSIVYAPPSGWRPEVALPKFSDVQHYDPHIATSSSGIHVILLNNAFDPENRCHEVGYDRSTDTGVKWDYNGIDANGNGIYDQRFNEDIAAEGSTIHAVYEFCEMRDDIRYAKSTDGGQTWDAIWISDARDYSTHAAIALKNNDTIFVVFADWRNGEDTVEVYFSRSTDGGSHWRNPSDTTEFDQRRTIVNYNSWHPDIAANDSYIHIVWADNRVSFNYDIFYNRSTDCGENWNHDTLTGNGLNLTDVAGTSEFPDLAISDNSVYIVWQETREDSTGIWFRRSTDNGSNWGNRERLSTGGGHPSIAADANGVYAVWEKDTYIYYRESTDAGASWSTTLRITNSLYADSFPDIVTDSYGRHIVFQRSNDYIWYKQRDIVKPDAPQNLHNNPWVVPPPVILYWYANGEADLKEYRIYRKRASDFNYSQIGSTTDTTYTDNTFPQLGCWYYYYVTAVDLATNESNPSNTIRVWVPNPGKRINFGKPAASPYNIERDGYYRWGASFDSTADFGDCLKYRFTDLIPKNEYVFGFVLFEPTSDSGRALSLEFESQSIIEDIAVPESTLYMCFVVPKPLYSSGVLDLGLNVATKEAVLSQILIWERASGGGPQYLQSVDTENGFHLRIYPNPVMKTVGIEYNLPKCTDIELSVFDVNGRLVEEISAVKKDAGIHTELFDITCLSQGVYFFRLKTTNHSEIQKVIFVK